MKSLWHIDNHKPTFPLFWWNLPIKVYSDSKVHGANTGSIWVLSAPDGPHVGPINFVIGVRPQGQYILKITIELYTWPHVHTMYPKYCVCCSFGIMILVFNTLKPRQNGRHFADDILKCIFFNKNVWIWIEMSLKFVPNGPKNNIPALVLIMALLQPGDKPLSEPMMDGLPTHKWVIGPQWINYQPSLSMPLNFNITWPGAVVWLPSASQVKLDDMGKCNHESTRTKENWIYFKSYPCYSLI